MPLSAHYFDTANTLLARHGFSLRLRKEDERWVQTLKGPGKPTTWWGSKPTGVRWRSSLRPGLPWAGSPRSRSTPPAPAGEH
jgi:hypothetical protein